MYRTIKIEESNTIETTLKIWKHDLTDIIKLGFPIVLSHSRKKHLQRLSNKNYCENNLSNEELDIITNMFITKAYEMGVRGFRVHNHKMTNLVLNVMHNFYTF